MAGELLPQGLAQKRELAFAASQFPALEINGTFYGLQRPEVFRRWAQATADDFVFAVKGSRLITHINSRYGDDALDRWAGGITAWAEGRPMEDGDFAGAAAAARKPRNVFVFFDNTDKLHAPQDAPRLMDRLGVHWHAEAVEVAA